MESNRPRNKPTHLWTLDFWQRNQNHTMQKGKHLQQMVLAGLTGDLHVKEWKCLLFKYVPQSITESRENLEVKWHCSQAHP